MPSPSRRTAHQRRLHRFGSVRSRVVASILWMFALIGIGAGLLLAAISQPGEPVQAAAITLRAATSAGSPSGSLTIATPAGTTTGDVMVASIAVQPDTATITAPVGWTLIRRT